MGEPNNVLKAYMKKPERVRSVLEYFLGRKLPQDWAVETLDGFYTVRNSRGKISFRERDSLSRIRAKRFSFQLGLENQEATNLTYPWRVMELDCLAYGEGIEEIQERNGKGKAVQGAARTAYGPEDDFKYRYRKEDRLEPILTLTLYWGRKKWETPLSLNEMANLAEFPQDLREKFVDYKVNLIHMRSIPDEDLQKMDSDLKYVIGIMKRTGSRKRYEEYIHENREYFSRIPRSAVDVIDVCTNIKDIRGRLLFALNRENGEEEADMCKALEDMKKHEMRQGMKQGVKQGIQRANMLVQRLIADGRQEDLVRAATDAPFQQKLFKEYHI